MKVLIIEDTNYKLNNAKIILKSLGITEYESASSSMKGLSCAQNSSYDLLITDLGLPIKENEDVTDYLEGLNMLVTLGNMGIFIPTIIFSSTAIKEQELALLSELGYPLLGQAMGNDSLKSLIASFLTSKEESNNQINSR